jgi:8-oxo-dGTP pyrophosphatase MutT (NUDIX family)
MSAPADSPVIEEMIREFKRSGNTQDRQKALRNRSFHKTRGEVRREKHKKALRQGCDVIHDRVIAEVLSFVASPKKVRKPRFHHGSPHAAVHTRHAKHSGTKIPSVMTIVVFRDSTRERPDEISLQRDMNEQTGIPKRREGFCIGQNEPLDDLDVRATSIRETEEELGIPPEPDENINITFVGIIRPDDHERHVFVRVVPFDTPVIPGQEIWRDSSGRPSIRRVTKEQLKQSIAQEEVLYHHQLAFQRAEAQDLI